MKKFLKSQKGINLISLSIAVMIILVLTGMIIYNVKDNLKLEKLRAMQSDIENLRDKVSSYYSQYGEIPADRTAEYTNIENIENAGVISETVDTGNFYVIDLSFMENITLNYGEDYEKIKSGEAANVEEINALTDLYIINDSSHNIFYVDGIEIDGERFYTDYTKEDVDTEAVAMRYVNNVEIPAGYTYLHGNNVDYLIEIQSDSEPDKILTWIYLEEDITEVPYDVKVEDEEEFLRSANLFNGYYKNMKDGTVLCLTVKDKWSPTYDKTATYKDQNGDTAVIPNGFQVSERQGETLISEGLVVKGPDGSEFVWVPVENINTMAQCETAGGDCNLQLVDGTLKCTNEAHSSTAEKIVGKLWATGMGENFGVENTVYEPEKGFKEPAIATGNDSGIGPGFDENTKYNDGLFDLQSMQNDYKQMITSVAKNKGFYIGRYETSLEGATETQAGTGKVQSKANVIPATTEEDATGMWYGIFKVQDKTYTGKDNSVQSNMIWGSQYDAMLNWIVSSSATGKNDIINTELVSHSFDKKYATGTQNLDEMNNIYDLGGNLWEWTLELAGNATRVVRGGNFKYKASASNRAGVYTNGYNSATGSRLALYIK